MASWELSKENIQPLRQGRKVSSMEPQDQRKISQEQQEFETSLRTYSGPDPLEPWHRYIVWVEQTFPKGGKEGNLQRLLEKCIQEFKDDPVQCQDERYLDVWIKYSTMSQAPLENYKFMAQENIGTSRPNFYITWAWELEQAGNFKSAEKVFARGLSLIVDESDHKYLDSKHKLFQARVMKKMMEKQDDDTDDIAVQAAEAEEKRTVLASLKGHGKQQKVGSIRIGAVKKSDGPGLLPASTEKQSSNSKKGFTIFQDGENASPTSDVVTVRTGSTSSNREKVVPVYKERNRENEIEAGKWSQAKLGKKSHAVPIDKISFKPAFSVHVDEDGERQTSLTTPHKLAPGESKVLATRKPAEEHDNVAIALFEPPNPMVKPMYCKHLVYQGVTEFSFEELRAIKYRRKRAEKEAQKMEEEKQRWKEEQNELLRKQVEAIEQQKEEMLKMARAMEEQKNEMQKFMEEQQRRQKEEFAKWMEAEKSKLEKQKIKMTASIANDVVINDVRTSYREQEQNENLSLPLSRSTTNRESSSVLDDTKALLQKTPSGTFESSNSKTPPRENFGDRLVQPSPTINTKEAFSLMQQMWKSSADSSNAPFEVYNDENPVKNVAPAKSSAVPFTIFCDEPESDPSPIKMSTKKDSPPRVSLPRPKFARPLAVHNDVQVTNRTPADKENVAIYCDENFLEPAKPVSKPRPLPIVDDNTTIRLPSMEAFAEMARTSSTPFHGRHFLPEEDDNTCNVEIAFKKPDPVPEPVLQQPSQVVENDIRLSPILEYSRENWSKSSSSSSNGSQTVAALTKSQWGNTHLYTNNVSSAVSSSRTPGTVLQQTKPIEVSCSSGYMADNSSARTPGIFLRDRIAEERPAEKSFEDKKESVELVLKENNPMKAPKYNFINRRQSEDDEEITGVLSDFMAEFNRNAGLNISTQRPTKIEATCDAQRTLTAKPEMMNSISKQQTLSDESLRNSSSIHRSKRDEIPNISIVHHTNKDETLNDDVTLQLSSRKIEKPSFQGRNLKSCSSFLSESLKMSFVAQDLSDDIACNKSDDLLPPSDDWNKMSMLSSTSHLHVSTAAFLAGNRSMAGPGPSFDDTGMDDMPPPTLDMTDCNSVSSVALEKSVPANPNPFSEALQIKFLSSIKRPVNVRHGYNRIRGCVPSIKPNSVIAVADTEFLIQECKGEGGYGKVFKALKKEDGANPNETIANIDVVLKLQKPPREWEFYICTELHERLVQSGCSVDRDWFMSIPRCYTYDDGSIFVSEHQSNTLLDVCNQIPALKAPDVEPIAMYFTIELLRIAEILRRAKIIHADIKPENFLLQRTAQIDPSSPNASSMFKKLKPALQVIDFGVSIDMSLFPVGTTFTHSFDKIESKSPDMLEGKPWTYQLDYFGIASVAFTLLNGSYLKVIKNKTGQYFPAGSFKRWWNVDLWTKFFDTFLNISSSESLPDLTQIREEFEQYFFEKHRAKFMSATQTLNSLYSKR